MSFHRSTEPNIILIIPHMNNQEQNAELELEEIKELSNDLRYKLMPYRRPILYIGVSIFILLIFFVGFALGGYKVCRQSDGFLDSGFQCHADYYNEQKRQQQKFNDYNFEVLNGIQN